MPLTTILSKNPSILTRLARTLPCPATSVITRPRFFHHNQPWRHTTSTPTFTPSAATAAQISPSIRTRPSDTGPDEAIRLAFDDPHYVPVLNLTHPTGLFGRPELATSQGFQLVADRAIDQAQRILKRIYRADETKDEQELKRVVKNMDRLSDTLCLVIDLAEFIRNVHPDRAFLEAANAAYERLCGYMNGLNTDVRLYGILKSILNDHRLASTLSDQAAAVAAAFMHDFERSGIHLPKQERERFLDLSARIITLGRTFTHVDPRATQYLTVPTSRLTGLGSKFIRTHASSGGQAAIPTTRHEVQMVLRYAHDPDVRKAMYIASLEAHPNAVETLKELLVTRGEIAQLVGYECYGEMILEDKMAGRPRNVEIFLEKLRTYLAPGLEREMTLLRTAKGREIGNGGTLNAWDRDYYIETISASMDRANGESIAPFFSVGGVVQGLSRLFGHMFGIRFEVASVAPGEVWSPDVRKFNVVDEKEGVIGTIYLDLFSREGKWGGAASYTVQCSRRLDDDDAQNDGDGPLLSPSKELIGHTIPDGPGLYQLPVVVLTCDFPVPLGNSPTLLNYSEVETLFHEMGHAMHSMLGRTEFHNVSGTRSPTDFVELPSILMEHFLSSERVLSLFARHYHTREPLPLELLRAHLTPRRAFKNLEDTLQIIMAMTDQALHSERALSKNFDPIAEHFALLSRVSPFPPTERTDWPTRFTHLYGYGASYYSYLFDRTLARQVWRSVFQPDPLSRAAGEKYRMEVLRWGGARNAWDCIKGVLGVEIESAEKGMGIVGEWGVEA